MKVRFVLASMALFLSALIYGQATAPMDIRGIVRDSKGAALQGINVTEKGTTNATTTNVSGEFIIKLRSTTATLVFSGTGFQTKEAIAEQGKAVEIVLNEDVKELSDVVVVGYGTQKKINLTGAIETINSKAFENRPVTNASAMLQGTAPSLVFSTPAGGNVPGSSPTIQIRGQAALGTTTPPLVVIDGIPASMTDLNAMNPHDIENISVLKDAAASAIYGARAPYGVLVVSTKMGKKNQKPVFTYSGNFSMVTPVRLPHTEDSYTFALSKNQAQLNALLAPYFSTAFLDIIQDNVNNPGKYSLAQLNPPNGAVWSGAGNTFNNNDMMDVWMRSSSFRQQHDISLKGGSDKMSYYLSAGYVDQPGVLNFIENIDNYRRYNINAGLVAQANDWLRLTFRTRYSLANSKAPTGEFDGGRDRIYQFAYTAWPTEAVLNPTGQYSQLSRILQSINGGNAELSSHRLDNILALDMDLAKGWTAHVDGTWRLAFDDYQKLRKTVYETGPTGIDNLVAGTESSIAKYNQLGTYWTIQGYSAYEHRLKQHTFRVQAGAQAEESNSKQLSGSALGLYVPDLAAIAIASGTRTLNNDIINTWATAGFFGRFNYDYDKRYLLEVNGRYDGSGRYSRDQRWGFFPSASVGWNMSNENFWATIKPIVNRAKIRASYGTVGNQGNAAGYLHVPTMTTGSQSPWIFNSARLPYVNTPGILNMERTWEKYTTADLGLELSFLQNRLTTEFDYFNRRSWDVVGPATPLPSVLGTTAPDVNNAEFVTKGWEIQMKWQDNITRKWDYSVGLSLADAMSEVTKYNTSVNLLSGWYVGKEFGEIWGYTANRFLDAKDFNTTTGKPIVDQSKINARWFAGDVKYEDLDGDGLISAGSSTLASHGDLRKIGNSTPRYRFAFNMATGYSFSNAGRIDLSLFFQGVGKQDLFMSSNYFYWGVGSSVSTLEAAIYQGLSTNYYRDANSDPRLLAHLGQNVNAYFPRPYNSTEGNKNFQTSTKYLLSAAYIRLKNVQATYTLPSEWLNRAKIKACSIYFSAENVAVWSKLPEYLDPEVVNGGKMYPQQAVYSMGVNLGF